MNVPDIDQASSATKQPQRADHALQYPVRSLALLLGAALLAGCATPSAVPAAEGLAVVNAPVAVVQQAEVATAPALSAATITPPAPPAPPVIPELPELVLAAHSLEIATNTRSVSGNVSANGNVSVGNLISSYSNTGNTSTPIGGGGSGGSVGCPAPWINITLADGSTI